MNAGNKKASGQLAFEWGGGKKSKRLPLKIA